VPQIKLSLGNWHACLCACLRLNEFICNSHTSVDQRVRQSHTVASYFSLWWSCDTSRELKLLKCLALAIPWIWRLALGCVDTNVIKSSDAKQWCRFANCWCKPETEYLVVAVTCRPVHWKVRFLSSYIFTWSQIFSVLYIKYVRKWSWVEFKQQ
jgi:hypothetical protein